VTPLRMVSCMAENTALICRQVAEYLAGKLRIEVSVIEDVPWQNRERLLDDGHVHICWLCGLSYVIKIDHTALQVELLAAPVPKGERYLGRPLYFSDVVVRRNSRFESFADLCGASWAYNEPRSHSGYNVMRYFLASRGKVAPYFKAVIESGTHRNSLGLILDGRIDSAAIDSTFLEWELSQNSRISNSLRIIETLGPSPIPPWVIAKSVHPEMRATVQMLLLQLDQTELGRSILSLGNISRFALVDDRYYDSIRAMTRQAEGVAFGTPLLSYK
jgi:phosphonate transport system substrate-binding protein